MIREITIDELEATSGFTDLLDEYAEESAIAGMPPPAARMDTYRVLQEHGLLFVYAAMEGHRVVGFISVLASVLPHYGRTVAVAESFFVAKAARSSLAGLKLLAVAEDKSRALKSPGLLVSAPYGGKLFELLPKLKYTETNRVFFKRTCDA